MKILTSVALAGLASVIAGCGSHGNALLLVDKDTILTAVVENGPPNTRAGFAATGGPGNPTLHRVLQSPKGTVLFAYDAEIRGASEAGSYSITLKPVKGSPTFAATREVTAQRNEDQVRVELVEDAVSHRKIVDVLQFVSKPEDLDIGGSLMKFHNHVFRMIHGK